VAQGVGPEFTSPSEKKKKTNIEKTELFQTNGGEGNIKKITWPCVDTLEWRVHNIILSNCACFGEKKQMPVMDHWQLRSQHHVLLNMAENAYLLTEKIFS
jgi:hypothetical protein